MPVYDTDVFVNCPFDNEYKPLFLAIVFTVIRSGYRARCALEKDNAIENRFVKICDIIGECRFAVHDISRTELNAHNLPRFNMPLELGLFFGAQKYGTKPHKRKECIVFDIEPFRFQQFISDIGGQDIHFHQGEIPQLINKLSAWLRHLPGGRPAGGGNAILREYQSFQDIVPLLCARKNLEVEELVFLDFNSMIIEFVRTLTGEKVDV